MATELYDLTIPVLIRTLENLDKILDKAEAFVAEQNIDASELLEARLIGDMGNLVSQVQRASDSAKGAAVRIGGVENVAMPDEEVSFADLHVRLANTVEFLKEVPAEAMNGKESVVVTLQTPNRSFDFTGQSYALGFVLPNVFFHVTTAYAILRMKGVPIGKMDYLGGI